LVELNGLDLKEVRDAIPRLNEVKDPALRLEVLFVQVLSMKDLCDVYDHLLDMLVRHRL
jgi:hypothetical protein